MKQIKPKSEIRIYENKKGSKSGRNVFQFGNLEIECEPIRKRMIRRDCNQHNDAYFEPFDYGINNIVNGLERSEDPIKLVSVMMMAATNKGVHEWITSMCFETVILSDAGKRAVSVINKVAEDPKCEDVVRQIAEEAIAIIMKPVEEYAEFHREMAGKFSKLWDRGYRIVKVG